MIPCYQYLPCCYVPEAVTILQVVVYLFRVQAYFVSLHNPEPGGQPCGLRAISGSQKPPIRPLKTLDNNKIIYKNLYLVGIVGDIWPSNHQQKFSNVAPCEEKDCLPLIQSVHQDSNFIHIS